MQVDAETRSAEAGEPAAVALRRGVVARAKAALRLLRSSLALVLTLFGATFFVQLLLGDAAMMLFFPISQAILVIVVLARAQGKTASFGTGSMLLLGRLPRIFRAYLRMLVSIMFWAVLGCGLVAGGFDALCQGRLSLGIGLLALGALPCASMLNRLVNFSLVEVVAAVDPALEPEDPLRRSLALVNVARNQALASGLAMMTLSTVASKLLAEAASVSRVSGCGHFGVTLSAPSPWTYAAVHADATFQAALAVFACAYWLLFYFETSKALKPARYPHLPAELLSPDEAGHSSSRQ